MRRAFVLAGVGGAVVGLGGVGGCASTWDTMSSNDFKARPFHHMFHSDDPLHTLRTNPEGGARAKAMNKLKEPIRNGGTQADQDEVVEQILGPAASTDPSPVVRAAAIDALGRFQDPRVGPLLVAAYQQASGRAQEPTPPPSPVQQVAAGGRKLETPKFGLYGPTGFPADTVALLRAKSLDGLSRTATPEAVDFLTQVAISTKSEVDPADRDTRLAAVRGLASMRTKEAVPALAKVLQAESGKDVALVGRAHAGLVSLTGKDLPPEPEKWNEVVQAGYTVAPEPTLLDKVTGGISIVR